MAPADALRSLRPRDGAEVEAIVRGHSRPLEPCGRGSKRAIGRPVDADLLDLSALDGIIEYAPEELVLTARAATRLESIEQTLRAHGQRLAFEPPDYGRLLGVDTGQTLGGILAANLAGSRRITSGAARDHFLGFEAVSGRGERFRAGGRVVKNVTGYDLPKLLAGSWGTLAVLTEAAVRVAPVPETERTLLVRADTPARASEILTAALGSSYDVSAAAYDPWRGAALRVEGLSASVAARAEALCALLGDPDLETIEHEVSRAFWAELGGATALADWPVVWRISVPPSRAPRVVERLEPERYLLDWGGGLIWAAFTTVDAGHVRGALGEGHATLIKAPAALRARTCAFQPPPASIAAALQRIKAAFDPDERLNPRRLD